jgi:photosystem II stability/assembly factor-like uncharacterized protein
MDKGGSEGMGTKLYIGTESGILALEGGNGSWETTDSGLEDKFIEKLELTESGRLYTGLPRDGVYKSEGALDSWSRTLEADVRGLAVSPHDPSVLFAGTEPAGVFRSLDGGNSWQELTEVKEVPNYSNWSFPAPPFVAHVRTFSFVAGDPQTVFAGVEVGGILRSLDGGDTWEEYGEGIYEDVHYLLGNPGNPDIVYSTTGEGFYRSTDRAKTWKFAFEGIKNDYTHPVVVRPDDPQVVFTAAASDPPPSFSRPTGAEAIIYRSNDAGDTWEPLTNGLPDMFHGMVRGLTIDPNNPDVVYAGSTDGEIYRSEDGGDSWSLMMDGLPGVWVIRVVAN